MAQMHRARRRPSVCCLASAGAAAPGTGGRPASLRSALAAPCRAALRPCQLPQMRLASARCSGPPLGTKAAAPAVSGPASAYRQPPLGFAACVGASAELRSQDEVTGRETGCVDLVEGREKLFGLLQMGCEERGSGHLSPRRKRRLGGLCFVVLFPIFLIHIHDLNSVLSNLAFPCSGRYCRYSSRYSGPMAAL